MILHRVVSTCGRNVPKPASAVEEEDFDEIVPMQDQIEFLRAKITLKEQYNRVLLENFEESRKGTTHALRDMMDENKLLREHLVHVLRNEENAVHKALRAYRHFQLAMTGRKEEPCIIWLEDKIFDARKRENCLLDKLIKERKVLHETELMVHLIEKYPRPGTLPWEIEAMAKFEKLENTIEDFKIKQEVSWMLNKRYSAIRVLLMGEQGRYLPILKAFESLVENLKTECNELQTMLDDAIYLKGEAYRNLILIEIEAKENRKARRKLMARMKKAVDAVLADNHHHRRESGKSKKRQFDMLKQNTEDKSDGVSVVNEFDIKTEIVDQYRDRARKLVAVMAVEDLTQIPARYKAVGVLGHRLQVEMDAKMEFRDLLIKQRDQLFLLLCHFRYTGYQKKLDHDERVAVIKSDIATSVLNITEATKRVARLGEITVDLRIAAVAILSRLTEWKRRYRAVLQETGNSGSLKRHLKKIMKKAIKLGKLVNEYEIMFGGRSSLRHYELYIRNVVPPRVIRVGTPVVSSDSDDDDLSNSGVPSREDIKAKSLRFIQLGMIRRGGFRM